MLFRSPKEQPITVELRGGEYAIAGPLVLGPEHSGTAANPVTVRPYGGETPRITGGRRLAGWTRHDEHLWKTEIAEVKAGEWRFTQLFVNGQRRLRARTPNEGFFRVAGFPDGGREVHYHTDCQRFEYRPGDINPDWTNRQDIDVIVYHF